jgi:hypothetical protein
VSKTDHRIIQCLKEAENAFEKAERYAKSAEVYNGRGLVLMKKGIRYWG